MAARTPKPRIVYVECATAHLYRWFRSQLTYVASESAYTISGMRSGSGFIVHNEERWAALLGASEGHEIASEITLRDKGRGSIALTIRDGVVTGATGSEPKRFMGLTESDARKLAAGRKLI